MNTPHTTPDPVAAIARSSEGRALTRDEEQELGRLYREPARRTDVEALMLDRNTGLIWNIVIRAPCPPLIDRSDLWQEGAVGLLHALSKWEPERGLKFSTYAHTWIWQRVQRVILEQSSPIRMAYHMHERQMPIKRARTMLGSQLGRDPTPEEIAAYLGQPTRYVTDALAARRTLQTISADAELSDVTGDSWYALLPDPDADTEATAMLRAEADELAGWMATLSPREREIIARYYGLAGGEAQTLEEIGQALGITRERVRQVKEVAMRKLQHQAGIEGVDTSARGMRRAG